MTRFFPIALAALAVSTPALAGDAEITLKAGIASMATALDEADPDGGWIATPAEPCAAKTKATILIESLGNASSDHDPVVCFNTEILEDEPFGVAHGETTHTLHKVGNITLKRGVFSVAGERGRDAAEIVAPATLTWTDVAFDNLAYLAVARDGSAQLVFPPLVLGLIGVEPDEID
jgi:hypothetical protein